MQVDDSVIWLTEPADSFKGGRDYVHGSDIVAALRMLGDRHPGSLTLTQVEFHNPLRSRGVVALSCTTPTDRAATSATAKFKNLQGQLLHCTVFGSPFPVSPRNRDFDEEALWASSRFDAAAKSAETRISDGFTVEEHMTSLMKLVCSRSVPDMAGWWFVRLTSGATIGQLGDTLEIRLRRLTAGRFASADILVQGKPSGMIEFIGRRA